MPCLVHSLFSFNDLCSLDLYQGTAPDAYKIFNAFFAYWKRSAKVDGFTVINYLFQLLIIEQF